MVKKEFGHIVMFALMSLLVVSGGYFAYNQVQSDKAHHLLGNEPASAVSMASESVIDTLQYLTDPTYEFCEMRCEKDDDLTCQSLSKTIVTVKQEGFSPKTVSSDEVRRLPLNASINFMFETYSVSRKIDSCSTTYYVTVESFDTYLENIQREFKTDYSTFAAPDTDELYEALCSGESLEWIEKFCAEPSPY